MSAQEAVEDPNFLRAAAPLAPYLSCVCFARSRFCLASTTLLMLARRVVAWLRLAATSHVWRAALASHLASRVDLTPSSLRATTDDVLRAAVALCSGLTQLDTRGCACLSREALTGVLDAHASTLQEVRIGADEAPVASRLTCAEATALLASAPRLRVFDAQLSGSAAAAAALLRAPQAQCRGVLLSVRCEASAMTVQDDTWQAIDAMSAFSGVLAGEPVVTPSPFEGAVRASGDGFFFEYAAALHGSASAPALLAAAQAHPRVLSVEVVVPMDAWEVSGDHEDGLQTYSLAAALGELIAANTPALKELRVRTEQSFADALAPLIEALPLNAHLTTLEWHGGCSKGALDGFEDFARSRLLPAVAANDSLRVLRFCNLPLPQLREAEAAVQRRSAA